MQRRKVRFLWLCFSEVYSLKEHEAVFLKRKKLIFSVVAGSIWSVFCSELHIFTSKILNLLLPLEAKMARGHESWCTYRSLRLYLTKKWCSQTFWKIHRKTPVSVFFNEVAGLNSAALLKKRLQHRCFPANFAKFLRAPFLQHISRQQLLIFLSKEFMAQQSDIPRLLLSILLFFL